MKPIRSWLPPLLAIALLGPGAGLRHPQVPEPGTGSKLNGVYCTSRASCWAVGFYTTSHQAILDEVLHWNGSAWARAAAPNPAGAASGDTNTLAAVRCAQANDCWAVGTYQKGSAASLSLALRWTGRNWFKVATPPTPGGTRAGAFSQLFDVACPAVTDCWAVGEYGTSSSGGFFGHNEALRWNGRKWSLVATPNPAGTAAGVVTGLSSIRCPSASYCLAVGSTDFVNTTTVLNETLRWNGHRWSVLVAPNPAGTGTGDVNALGGVACISSRNCWAVGTYGRIVPDRTLRNQALHWNGHGWSKVTMPETATAAENMLGFVACGSATDCWAVGSSSFVGGVEVGLNEALHWDGRRWSLVDTPDPAGVSSGDMSRLSAVGCVTARNCWAVGTARSGAGVFGEGLHWNGVTWSVR